MKDWKREYDVARGEVKKLQEALNYEIKQRESREYRDRDIVDRFKELLIDVIGRK